MLALISIGALLKHLEVPSRHVASAKSPYRISERIRYDLLHLKSIARWRCWTDKDESIAILVISLY